MSIHFAFLTPLLQSTVLVEKWYGGSAKRHCMVDSVIFGQRRKIPDGDSDLRAYWAVFDQHWQVKPLIPSSAILEVFVRGLHGHSQRLGFGP